MRLLNDDGAAAQEAVDVVNDRGSKGEDGMGQRDQVMHDDIPHVRG